MTKYRIVKDRKKYWQVAKVYKDNIEICTINCFYDGYLSRHLLESLKVLFLTRYDSKGEASFAMELDFRMKAGEFTEIQRQVTIPLVVNGVKICSYVADFITTDKYGAKKLWEYKGFKTDLFNLKWKLLNALRDEIFPEGIELDLQPIPLTEEWLVKFGWWSKTKFWLEVGNGTRIVMNWK